MNMNKLPRNENMKDYNKYENMSEFKRGYTFGIATALDYANHQGSKAAIDLLCASCCLESISEAVRVGSQRYDGLIDFIIERRHLYKNKLKSPIRKKFKRFMRNYFFRVFRAAA